jgi:hypothetical protein
LLARMLRVFLLESKEVHHGLASHSVD